MFEAVGDIWEYSDTSVIVITTNGSLTCDGRAIFGRGVARQAALRFPDLAGNYVAEKDIYSMTVAVNFSMRYTGRIATECLEWACGVHLLNCW